MSDWINVVTENSSITVLIDVDTTTTPPTLGNKLQWNGSAWVPTSAGGLSKTITIEDVAAETLAFFFSTNAFTITRVRALVQGTGPSVPVTIASGTTYLTPVNTNVNAQTASNTTNGADLTIADSTVAQNSHIWITTGTVTGTIDLLTITIDYTES